MQVKQKSLYNFNNIPTMGYVSICVTRIAIQWQIEIKECLLSFGTECFVLQFAFQKKKIKFQIHRTVTFVADLYESKIGL